MTREEAFRKLKKHKINIRKSELVDLKVVCYDLINEIYKDFESRVCKNCKLFDKEKVMFGCRIAYAAFNHPVLGLDENNFGCNRFERRENEGY